MSEYNDYWELKPKTGLGRIQFGDSIDTVNQFNSEYGTVVSVKDTDYRLESSDDPNSLYQQTMELLRSAAPDVDWEKMNEEVNRDFEENVPEAFKNMIEERREPWLSLSYKNDELCILSTGLTNKKAHFKGKYIFLNDGKEIVKLLETEYGSPVFNGRDLYFVNALLTLSDFYVLQDGTGVFTNDNSGNVTIEEYQRTITIYSEKTGGIESHSGTFKGYEQISFI